jgi:hypothetical protein
MLSGPSYFGGILRRPVTARGSPSTVDPTESPDNPKCANTLPESELTVVFLQRCKWVRLDRLGASAQQ